MHPYSEQSRSSVQSLRQAEAAQQVGEAWVGAQGVPEWVHFNAGEETKRTLLVSLFEPREGLVLVLQSKINHGLEDKDQAFTWLEKAYEERSFRFLASVKVDPLWDSLRSDPRFADLLCRLSLPL